MNSEHQVHGNKHTVIVKEKNLQESSMFENDLNQNNKRFEEVGLTNKKSYKSQNPEKDH